MTQENHSGHAIRQLLDDNGVSVKEIARRLDLTEQSVYETLRKEVVRKSTALKYYYALGIDMPNMKPYKENKEILNMDKEGHIDKDAYILELKERIAEQSKQIAEQTQMMLALIEQMGKFKASELLAGAYA